MLLLELRPCAFPHKRGDVLRERALDHHVALLDEVPRLGPVQLSTLRRSRIEEVAIEQIAHQPPLVARSVVVKSILTCVRSRSSRTPSSINELTALRLQSADVAQEDFDVVA